MPASFAPVSQSAATLPIESCPLLAMRFLQRTPPAIRFLPTDSPLAPQQASTAHGHQVTAPPYCLPTEQPAIRSNAPKKWKSELAGHDPSGNRALRILATDRLRSASGGKNVPFAPRKFGRIGYDTPVAQPTTFRLKSHHTDGVNTIADETSSISAGDYALHSHTDDPGGRSWWWLHQ